MKKFLFIYIFLYSFTVYSEWSVDFSRRNQDVKHYMPDTLAQKQQPFFESLLAPAAPMQEVVILNTKNGFVPKVLRLKTGARYKVNLVNIDKTNQNISFIMDQFGEHHATYYGQVKKFMLEPTEAGVFKFQCPETSAEGKLIVFASEKNLQGPSLRFPASKE